jgi:hypothetical protein
MLETKCIIFLCYIKCFEIILQKHLLQHLSLPTSFVDCTFHVPLYLAICVLPLESTHYFCYHVLKLLLLWQQQTWYHLTTEW